MRLDSEGCAVEGGAQADVGNGAAALGFAVEKRACDVDAAGGQELLIGNEIERGHGEAVADAGSGDNFSCENEWPAKQAAGVGDIAFRDFTANDRAADSFAVIDNGRNDDNFKSEAGAKFSEQSSVAGLLVSEAEIFPDEKRANAKLLHENLFDEVFGRKLRELLGKRLHNGGFEADDAEPGEPLFGGGEAFGSYIRAQDF